MTRTVVRKAAFALFALVALTGTASAGWREQISDSDTDRLNSLDTVRDQALKEAESRGGSGDFQAIKETLQPQPRGVPATALIGSWRCRQMKLGGLTGYYVFSWFPCHISKVNGGIWFEKDGTQRMAGYLYPEDSGLWVYLGAQSAKGEPIHRYSGRAASVGAIINPDDQVGALVGIGNNRLRIDLPKPATQESDFDAIELVR